MGDEPATSPDADGAASSDDDDSPLLLVVQRARMARAAKEIADARRDALQELADAVQGPDAAPPRAAYRGAGRGSLAKQAKRARVAAAGSDAEDDAE